MRSWRGNVRRGKTRSATAGRKAAATTGSGKATAAAHTAAAHVGTCGKAAASTTAAAKMVLRVRASRNAGRSKKDKGERNRTHGLTSTSPCF
jgi:hypothetical protein